MMGNEKNVFQLTWVKTKDGLLTVMNQMLIEGTILDTQKHYIIVCLPKTRRPVRPDEY